MLIVGNCLTKAFKDMKSFFLPYNFKNWFKFGIIAVLAGRFGGNLGSNYNFSGGSGSELESFEIAKYLGWIIFGVASVVVFGLIMTFIGSVVTYILIENCDQKKMKLSFKFKKNLRKGWQLFLFSIIMMILGIIIVVGLAWPFISVIMLNGWSFSGLTLNSYPWNYLWLGIPLFLVWIIISTVISFLVTQYAVFDVFRKNVTLWKAIKNSWKMFKKHLGEFVLYYLLLIGVSLAIVMGLILVVLTLFIPIGILLFLLMLVAPVATSILVLILTIILLILSITFIGGPMSYLLTRFSLNFYDAIGKKK